MNRTLIITIILFSLGFPQDLFCEEVPEDNFISITEERRDVLKYGIESEIIDLIKKLSDEKNTHLTPEIASLFISTSNNKILQSCLEYFIEIKYFKTIEKALSILEDYDNQERELIRLTIRYLTEAGEKDAIPVLEEILSLDDPFLVQSAVTAFGKLGNSNQAIKLLDKLDDEYFPTQVKPEIIRTIGELKVKEAVPQLISILQDTTEQPSWRWNACEALGKIGDTDGLKAMKNSYISADPTLRSYIVLSMKYFKPKEVEEFLIEALRDSFWRVRVQASASLGEIKTAKALEILQYKAQKDPENNVRIAALKAIGELDLREGYDLLRTILKDEKASLASRQEAGVILITKDLTHSLSSIEEVLLEEWSKEKSRLLDTLCKNLSTAKNPDLEGIYGKMLDHKEITIKIYALRGIELNPSRNFIPKVEALTQMGAAEIVRKHALSALKLLQEIP